MAIISTIYNNCKHCYACIRNCPVKAIKVEDGQAQIIEKYCINCGQCRKVCSQNAKEVQNDKDNVLNLLKKQKTIALLAPSFVAAFEKDPYRTIGVLKELGFDKVCEVAYGAELVAEEYNKQFVRDQQKKPVLTSPCPVIINLVEKHYPKLTQYLMPVVSPMIAASRVLQKMYGNHYSIIFIGPCIAKKSEITHPHVEGDVDYVLTFTELKEMLSENKISIDKTPKKELDKPYASEGAVFPLPGGLLKAANLENDILNHKIITAEGEEDVFEILDAIKTKQISNSLIDILYCKGCIDGPEINNDKSLFYRKKLVADFAKQKLKSKKEDKRYTNIVLTREFSPVDRSEILPDDHQISEILKATGKINKEDQLNCGACGYNSCKEKAKAVYRGVAEIEMCLPYLLEKASTEAAKYKEEYQRIKNFQEYKDSVISESEKMQEVKSFIYKAAKCTSTVLLLGESGTGKGLIAETIHICSSRNDKPFIKVNCSAIPESLLESELFGYVGGAFTGADKNGRKGKFEEADGGIIFLDEIGDMSLSMQAKILHVLQEKIVQRVGSNKPKKINTHIIAATNKDLTKEIEKGNFREDLYYRLNVLTTTIPPLRERTRDIPVLLEHISQKLCQEQGFSPKKFDDGVIKVFKQYSWPGNIRELENITERLYNLVEEDTIKIKHLPQNIIDEVNLDSDIDFDSTANKSSPSTNKTLEEVIAKAEKDAILNALNNTRNNRTKAAKILGIHRTSLYEKLRKHKLD
ncbi:sigma 54-interacting transcriptional regulator [Natranaerofaba carboxydovora]|uniref:sigma 54-interacting transcriptional regulator n=1 Tax=Natranaerofaba carboxydovora TaxID=2742683 RepID=UPI001F12F49C|nr:sigma 54-interacting transcriptional regulator [Natranaerofaba carboxydovora]UMZ72770.1 Transcriptional regulatory protein ZraR [Natranaerofaba carboxydovora]